jgi:hypothetical protein
MQNRDMYVQRYILDPPLKSDPQTPPMALGSSFDSFAKNELARCLYGGAAVKLGTSFHLETLFKKQVGDEGLQNWAWEEGGYLFLRYKDLGAFDDLLIDLEGHQGDIIFDEECLEEIELPTGYKVPIRGYPDCAYTNREGALVILDWKCNNYCGSKNKSPSKNYILERPSGRAHKNVTVKNYKGMTIQDDCCFSETDEKWATQIVMYSWLLGKPIVNDTICQIEQLLCQPGERHHPDIRAVTYRGFASDGFQSKLAEEVEMCWKILQSGHIYDKLSREDSDLKIKSLQRHADMLANDNPILSILSTYKES